MRHLLFITFLLLFVGFAMVPVAIGVNGPPPGGGGGPAPGGGGGPSVSGCPEEGRGGIRITNPLDACDFADVVEAIARFIFMLSIPITTIVFVVGGYQFLTAAGDPEKLQRARATLLWAAIGFALVLISFSVTRIIREVLQL